MNKKPIEGTAEENPEVSADAVREQLKMILASPAFEATKAQHAFLGFIVEKMLTGRSHEIKGYTVATRVFGRPENFDQTRDPIVSIHANKLRRALERYYLLAGRNDLIRIDIPKGTYVPTFRHQPLERRNSHSIDRRVAVGVDGAWPSLLVQPFNNLTGDSGKDCLGIGFAAELAVELARIQEIKVLFPMEAQTNSGTSGGCRFVLGGNIYEADTGVRITVHMTDMKTGLQIWGDTHRSPIEAQKMLTFQERVAHIIAVKIAGEYGVIPKTLVSETRSKPPAEFNTYEAILRFYAYDHSPAPDCFTIALESLHRAAALEPDCGQVWSMLARLYANVHSLDFPGFKEPLEKALEYGIRGVRINPDNQRALGTLALVRFFSNELPSAIKEIDHAVELNPNSLFVLDGLGYIMTLCGEWERGTGLIKSVMQLNPFYRPTVHYALWADCLRRRDFEGAYLETMNLRGSMIFWYPMAKAATLGLVGRTEKAKPYLKKLLDLRPDFPAKCRMLIGRYIKFDEIIEYVVDGLRKAGLDEIVEQQPPA